MGFEWQKIKRAFRLQLPPDHPYEAGPVLGSRPYEALPVMMPVVTYSVVLIAGILLYFTDIHAGSDPQTRHEMLNKLGHRDNLNIILGDWWALVGNAFFHGNVMHFFLNATAMLSVGTALERGLGSLKTLGLYLLFAFISTGYQLLVGELDLLKVEAWEFEFWTSSVHLIFESSLGLSGILFAVIGFMWGSWKRWTGFLSIFNRRLLNFVFMWQGLCFVLTYAGTGIHIANTAHISGLIFGFFTGMWMCYGIRFSKLWFGLWAAMLALLIGGLVYYYLHYSMVLETVIPVLEQEGYIQPSFLPK